jgi:tRNA(Ile)-lysidine synthase
MISSLQIQNGYLQKLRRFIRRHEMLLGGEQVLVAVSGGVDSMALLDMMLRLAPTLRLGLGVAHFDHRLRGEASAQDATFVVDQAKLRGLKSFVGQADVKGLASSHSWSIEEAARNARYTFLKRVARKHGYSVILTAHNADDNAETLLLNLLRGSGVTGLAGIPPIRPMGDGIIVARPLLGTDRSEIEKYAAETELQWREDESNQSTQFKRNRVRHELLPSLKEYNPNIIETLNTTAGIMRSVEQYLTHSVEIAMKRVVASKSADQVEIHLHLLKHYLPAIQGELVQRVVSKVFNVPAISYGAVDRVLSLIWKESGSKVDLGGGLSCIRDRETICVRREVPPMPPVEKSFEPGANVDAGRAFLKTRRIERQSVRFTRNSNVEFIDTDRLSGNLLLRSWRDGDRFHPFGMEGEKKVSDLLVDLKVPVDRKKEVLVVTDGEEIVWVCGLRLDDRYKVGNDTKNVLRMEFSTRSMNGQ